jgi:hypothetical protein
MFFYRFCLFCTTEANTLANHEKKGRQVSGRGREATLMKRSKRVSWKPKPINSHNI